MIDHATGEKGNALHLVKGALQLDDRQAIEWSKKWLDRVSGQPLAPVPKAGDDGARTAASTGASSGLGDLE